MEKMVIRQTKYKPNDNVTLTESVLLWEFGMTTRKLDLVPDTPAPELCFVRDFGTKPGEVLSDMVGEGC